MSRREVIDCDHCDEKSVPFAVIVHITVGEVPCPAGGRSEEDRRRVDLCSKCAASLLEKAVNSIDDYKEAMEWYKAAITKIKR